MRWVLLKNDINFSYTYYSENGICFFRSLTLTFWFPSPLAGIASSTHFRILRGVHSKAHSSFGPHLDQIQVPRVEYRGGNGW